MCKIFGPAKASPVARFPDNPKVHKVKYDRPGECSPEKDCLR